MQRRALYITLKFLFILVLLFSVDRSVGTIFQRLIDLGLEKSPNKSRTEYTMRKVNSEVLIMGSSRAHYHYVSTIISDSLDRTVFNCGSNGQEFPYHVSMVHAVLKRYSPETIIIDINPLMLDNNTAYWKLNELYPYYNDDDFYKKIILMEDSNNRYKMLSEMYRYNSKVVALTRRIFFPDEDEDNGYTALTSNGYKYPLLNDVDYERDDLINSNNIELLLGFIAECKERDINLIFSVSPRFQESNVNKVRSYIHFKKLLERNDVPLIYMGDNTIINDSTMYYDEDHMNHKGAVAFTQAFAGRLKKEIAK